MAGDACSLVDAFRAGERSPVEELEATPRRHRGVRPQLLLLPRPRAGPGGGGERPICRCPSVACRPASRSSSRSRAGRGPRRRSSTRTGSPPTRRTTSSGCFERGGVVPVGLTTASEFGGLNVSVTKINGVTHNPWRHGRTVGGSSSGSAAAVAGGLVSLATGGDGGGSIRIPAGYTGLLGMKGTFGRIPRARTRSCGPTPSCSATSPARSATRPLLRRVRRRAPLGPVQPAVRRRLGGRPRLPRPARAAGRGRPGARRRHPRARRRGPHPRARPRRCIDDTGMVEVDLRVEPPNLAAQWMMGNLATLARRPRGPVAGAAPATSPTRSRSACACRSRSTTSTPPRPAEELRIAGQRGDGRARSTQVDFIIAATNPGPAFAADAVTSSSSEQLPRLGCSTGAGPLRAAGRCSARAARGRRSRRSCRRPCWPGVASSFPDLVNMGALDDHLEHLRQPGRVDPGRARSTACPWACRCWPATTRTPSSSTSPSRSSGSAPGRWSPRASEHGVGRVGPAGDFSAADR